MATAAANIPLVPGDNVVVPNAEHASAFHKWRVRAAEAGADLRAPDVAPDGDWTETLIAAIDDRTQEVVSAPHVHWSDGRLFDLARIGAAARRIGAVFVIDGAPSRSARCPSTWGHSARTT